MLGRDWDTRTHESSPPVLNIWSSWPSVVVSVSKSRVMIQDISLGTTVMIQNIPWQCSTSHCNLCYEALVLWTFQWESDGDTIPDWADQSGFFWIGWKFMAGQWSDVSLKTPYKVTQQPLSPSFLGTLWSISLWAGSSAVPPTHCSPLILNVASQKVKERLQVFLITRRRKENVDYLTKYRKHNHSKKHKIENERMKVRVSVL